MEKFKKTVNRRISYMGGLNALALVFIALTGLFSQMTSSGSRDMSDMIHGFQVGLFIGFQMVLGFTIAKYKKAVKNEVLLNKLYIEENDERTRLIQDKIGGTGFNFVIAGITLATLIAGFLNQVVFFTLLAALGFIVLVKGSLKVYYRKKF